MQVTITFDPNDRKEVSDLLTLISPDTAKLSRAEVVKIVRSYAMKVAEGECSPSTKEVTSYVHSLNLIRK